MSIEQLAFLQEVHGKHGLIEVAHGKGAAFVSVRTGPFLLEVDLADLSSVISTLAYVLHTANKAIPIRLQDGCTLHIALGEVDRANVWISSGDANLRLDVDIANQVLAVLSEARRAIRPFTPSSVMGSRWGASC